MHGITIKVILGVLAFIILVVFALRQANSEKKKEQTDTKSSELDVDIKEESYWEQRFNGLKQDYIDRENYHKSKYEQLKTEYDSREQFLRDMLDESRKDYTTLKQEVQELQEIKTQLDDRLRQARQIIADYEMKSAKMEQRLAELDPSFVIDPPKFVE